jgi:glutaredoxin-like protein DUF836
MAQALRALGVEFDEVDVDSDPRLRDAYGADVPVLVDSLNNPICRHRLSPEAIEKLR